MLAEEEWKDHSALGYSSKFVEEKGSENTVIKHGTSGVFGHALPENTPTGAYNCAYGDQEAVECYAEQIEPASRLYCERKGINPEEITSTQGVNQFYLREWQLVASKIREKLEREQDERLLQQVINEVADEASETKAILDKLAQDSQDMGLYDVDEAKQSGQVDRANGNVAFSGKPKWIFTPVGTFDVLSFAVMKRPNWFWRLTTYLILGFKWEENKWQ